MGVVVWWVWWWTSIENEILLAIEDAEVVVGWKLNSSVAFFER